MDAGLDAQSTSGALTIPSRITLPYVVAGAGGSMRTFSLLNPGDAAVTVTLSLEGDPRFSLTVAPAFVPAAGAGPVEVRFSGGATPGVALGTLLVTTAAGTTTVPLYAVVGAVGVPTATYEAVTASDGRPCGDGTTIALPTAPFPDPSGAWTDPSVRIFVPEGYRDRGRHDVALHFHGHDTTLAATLVGHRLEQQLCASGVDAILVVPQGPVNAASGNFGKLMSPTGTLALLEQVIATLYRDERITVPLLGELVLTAHSGGYQAVAANATSDLLPVTGVYLFDALYGATATYETYARSERLFRSNYTSAGGTLAANQALVATLELAGVSVTEDATHLALRDVDSVIDFADTTHARATRFRNAYGDRVRFGSPHHRRGARIELREATATTGTATVRWLAPRDAERTGFVVEASVDGTSFTEVARVADGVASASFPLAGTRWVRVRSELAYEPSGAIQPSDTYAVSDGASVLVVDAFERQIGGSFAGLAHDFAARVGRHVGASTISARALTEDGFDLTGYETVIWLAGDQSTDDLPVDADARGILSSYLAAGGRLLMSGSEIGFTLASSGFLASLGASYVADDAASSSVTGTGPLASFGSASFAGVSAPYLEDYPDVLAPTNGGVTLLSYGTGTVAAVGIADVAVLVGFPLELIDDPERLASLLTALLGFLGSPG